MKVGIYAATTPMWGGAYQHECAVLQCLRDYAGDSGHEFIVFTPAPHFEPSDFVATHMSFVRLPVSQPQSGRMRRLVERFGVESTLPYRIARKSFKLRRQISCGVQPAKKWIGPLEAAVVAKGVEVMFYASPNEQDFDLPYILTIFDLQHRLQPEFPEISFAGLWEEREAFYSKAIPRAVAIIVGSDAEKDDVIRFYRVPDERIKVLRFLPARSLWTVPSESETISVLKKYGIPGDYLFYPAQFWPHKNHTGLLRAVHLLREAHGVVLPVVLVGSDKGNLDHVKELVTELNLQSQVFHLGFVPDGDMPSLYRNALALVMPTYFGPTNMPVLEAFASECPVITSDVRGQRELVGEAALLVNPRRPASIAEAIRRLNGDISLREMLVRRGKQVASQWNAKDYAQSLVSTLDEFEPVRRCWGVWN